jgi:L-lactate dehydrogenase complex protein LldG
MIPSRESFLERVRKSVAAGNRAGVVHPLPERDGVGYQGAGPDPLARFQQDWTLAGGQFHLLQDAGAAREKVLDLIKAHEAKNILLGNDPLLLTLNLQDFLQGHALAVTNVNGLETATSREPFFAADLGISGVGFLVAETGTVVMGSSPGQPRSLSLLPPVHIALAQRRQIVPDLFDLFEKTSEVFADFGSLASALPSCLTLITGPSKTGDIELRLVTGVHGPGTVHVLLLDS